MKNQNHIYEIALTLVKGIGPVISRQLIEILDDLSFLFIENKRKIELKTGLPRKIIAEIHNPDILKRAEKELLFMEKKQIKPIFVTSPDYPQRLKDCPDAPILLYSIGNMNLNASKSISIVGTRNATSYGKEITRNLLKEIRKIFPDTLIISGLAYGIDIEAHKAAVDCNLQTVAVLAHGLDRIYPFEHRKIAEKMMESGGLLTDYLSETNPDRQNFVKRNRIVAGMADCTIVVESAKKGGALITARIASSYHKDVFCFPGKITDTYSAGCNALIRDREAALVTSGEDVFREMNWTSDPKETMREKVIQQDLFLNLSPEEQAITEQISRVGNIQLNQLSIKLNIPVHQLSVMLFELEMSGIICCKPGGLYSIR